VRKGEIAGAELNVQPRDSQCSDQFVPSNHLCCTELSRPSATTSILFLSQETAAGAEANVPPMELQPDQLFFIRSKI